MLGKLTSVFLVIFVFDLSSEAAGDVNDFLRMSQNKDALKKEDCVKHGGNLAGIKLKKLKSGQQSKKYNNLVKFEDYFYIVFSYRSKSNWKDIILGPEYTAQVCKFRY